MASLNMANMNTLFRKGYLLAGVVMAANMFVVNEVRAMKTNDNEKGKKVDLINKKKKGKKKGKKSGEQGFFDKVLYYEHTINLIGGTVSSVANNYFKLWDYNPGWYRQFGCLGWKSKRFLYGVLQFEVNFNLGRGAFWAIPNIIKLIMIKTSKEGKKNGNFSWTLFFFSDILRGFTSMPLTFHISKFNFSISISLDSIIWWGIIDNILKLSGKKKVKGKKDEDEKEIGDMQEAIEMEELIDTNGNDKDKNKNPKKEDEKKDDKKEEKKEDKKEEKKEEPIIEEKKEEEKKEDENNNNNNNNKSQLTIN